MFLLKVEKFKPISVFLNLKSNLPHQSHNKNLAEAYLTPTSTIWQSSFKIANANYFDVVMLPKPNFLIFPLKVISVKQ